MSAVLADLASNGSIALAVGVVVTSLTRLLIVKIALKDVPSDKKASIIRALAGLFKADVRLGPFHRGQLNQREPEDPDNPGNGEGRP
jgi:hypothetical protein